MIGFVARNSRWRIQRGIGGGAMHVDGVSGSGDGNQTEELHDPRRTEWMDGTETYMY
jgi:hypothetical protein